MIRIYLAGPITGCTEGQANDWRTDFAARLESIRIRGISPLRCEPLHGPVYGSTYNDSRFGTAKAISSKNLMDLRRCDLTLAYFPYAETARVPSIGTILEIGAAHENGKPIIVVSEHPKTSDHPVLNAFAGWMLSDLNEAFETIQGLFGEYTRGFHE
jgi:nucleoside 2-deoxyribosyltransferase